MESIPIHPAVEALFQYTLLRVTEEDIVNYSPSDPGYGAYVEEWKLIRRTGRVPKMVNFEVSEVIGLTGWADASEMTDPERFRAYRRFTTAAALVGLYHGYPCECVRESNYLARDLLIDLDAECARHRALVRQVLPPVHDRLVATGEEGYPFFTFASMLLSQREEDWPEAHRAATRLIAEEQAVRKEFDWMVQDGRFLLGLSNYDQLHRDWLAWARQLRNPMGDEDTQLVMEALG